jgi:hypothetical protein
MFGATNIKVFSKRNPLARPAIPCSTLARLTWAMLLHHVIIMMNEIYSPL